MVKEKTAINILTGARRKLGRNWTQGTLGYEAGAVCAIGALSYGELECTGQLGKGKLTTPRDDFNGQYEAVVALYEALPKYAQTAKSQSEYNMKYHTESTVRRRYFNDMLNRIVVYNDTGNRHHRTITKWFDRALARVKG